MIRVFFERRRVALKSAFAVESHFLQIASDKTDLCTVLVGLDKLAQRFVRLLQLIRPNLI